LSTYGSSEVRGWGGSVAAALKTVVPVASSRAILRGARVAEVNVGRSVIDLEPFDVGIAKEKEKLEL
jgi:hypothetical protein